MISVEMLPAGRGDALLVEWGPDGDGGAVGRMLIDGGPVNSGLYDGVRARLQQIPTADDGRRHIDLLIVTHVDTDHIEGVIRLLQDDELRLVFEDVWYNGWKHISTLTPTSEARVLGGIQGEFLDALLSAQGRPWNQLFGGGAVVVGADQPLPVVQLRGGMTLTLLSPSVPKLEQLADEWENVVRDAGFTPGDSATVLAELRDEWWARPHVLGDDDAVRRSKDNSEANGSSIAVLAEHGGRRVILAGDAHDDVLTTSLRAYRAARSEAGPLAVDAFKLSHHGSINNLSEQLLTELSVDQYLVSTNGKRFDHPDALAIQRLIDRHRGAGTPIVCFNYDQPQTTTWRNRPDLQARYGPAATVTLTAR